MLYSSVVCRIDIGGISTMLLNAENAICSFVSFVESVDPDPEVKQPSPIVGCCRVFVCILACLSPSRKYSSQFFKRNNLRSMNE